MAKNINNTLNINTVYPLKRMVKDVDPQLFQEGDYTNAINSQNKSKNGDQRFLQNEPSNILCLTLKTNYKLIGTIKLQDDEHVIFSTDNTNSEIGLFNSNTCSYSTIINTKCLNFKTTNLIKGVYKSNYDCSISIYWCDDLNPNRHLNLSNIPYKYTLSDDGCNTKIYTDEIDCEQLNVNPIITLPTLEISKSDSAGSLYNGAYQATIAYSINGITVSKYYSTTSPQLIFSQTDNTGAVEVNINSVDTDFEEFKLFIIATVAQQTTVYEIGTYNINTKKVLITDLTTKTTVPLQDVFLQNVVFEKSRNVIETAKSLLWVGAKTYQELDYQKQALNINSEWVAYRVPKNYYRKGGNLVGYMRDEVYAFGIQWFNKKTGAWTSAYHIPGRASNSNDTRPVTNNDAYELTISQCEPKSKISRWEIYDTSSGSFTPKAKNTCDEVEVGSGIMSYHQSTDVYPDNEDLFGDLKCQPIRHHRFPSDSRISRISDVDPNGMFILGVRFKNIEHPRNADGSLNTDYTHYRIVRGDRTNDKSILGKGLLYNTRYYDLQTTPTTKIPALYPNYPYNDLRTDPFLSKKEVTTKANGKDEKNYVEMSEYKQDIFTFHSPSYSFNKPSFGNELRLEVLNYGDVTTTFKYVDNHPKNKLLTSVGLLSALMLGVGEALIATNEQKKITTIAEAINPGMAGPAGTGVGNVALTTAFETYNTAVKNAELLLEPVKSSVLLAARTAFLSAASAALVIPAAGGKLSIAEEKEQTPFSRLPVVLKTLNQVYLFSFYFQQGAETALNFINSYADFEPYALQSNSYCFYNKTQPVQEGNKRRFIEDVNYLYPVVQDFNGFRVNNFKRESSVVVKIANTFADPSVIDTSRETISSKGLCESDKGYTSTASSYYASIRNTLPNQYGQINAINYLDTGTVNNAQISKRYTSNIIFGGDTYLNRFSLKRKMHYFNQTAYKENDGYSFDYKKYYNIPYARFWADTFKYDLTDLIDLTDPQLPTAKHNLDCKKKITKSLNAPFIKRNQYFYLFNSGIVDFFVESEFNIDFREQSTQDFLKHYDYENFTDLDTLFRHDVLHHDNHYKIDKSFLKQLIENYIPAQSIYFDKEKSETCFVNYENRVFWSLTQFKEQIKDSWKYYLPNNYYDFSSSNGLLIGAKALSKTNIAFLFQNAAPHLHISNDILETDGGVKIQIGDGGLFAKAPEPIISTDINFGTCNSSLSIINTPYGVIYVSEKQGKIFLLAGSSLKEISLNGMKAWFNKHIPLQILKDFPDYKHFDNTVKGVGFISGFDPNLNIYYLSKKDYKVLDQHKNNISYNVNEDSFYYTNSQGTSRKIDITNPLYFEDISWTVSYDFDEGSWVSFHDWKPNFMLQDSNNLFTIINPSTGSIWLHNSTCSSYCKYYNTQYNWEFELLNLNKKGTAYIKSLEYTLESFKYDNNCIDKFHQLLDNFSHMFIYNTEQTTGMLKLDYRQPNNPIAALQYPIIDDTNKTTSILFSKEEQKYRVNSFWDVTKDRGEFTTNTFFLINTANNGYNYSINPTAIDLLKSELQRKTIRSNYDKIYFIKKVDENVEMNKMIFKFLNIKTNLSII